MIEKAWRLKTYEVLPSTSDLCRSLAEAGEPDGLAILARRQTNGRGSRGREWISPPGNLNLSVLIRPSETLVAAAQWSLLAAVALAEALSFPPPRAGGAGEGVPDTLGTLQQSSRVPNSSPVPSRKGSGDAGITLKWPNDLLLDNRKIAGILLDSADNGQGGLAWLVIGMGVNLAAAPVVADRDVGALNSTEPPEQIAQRVLARLTAWRKTRHLEGFAPIRAAWLARAQDIGAPISLRIGTEQRGGQFEGLADDGSLLLRTGGRVHAFTTGEVMLGGNV